MKLTAVLCLTMASVFYSAQFSHAAQEISIDTSTFEDEFPEDKYLFYMTGFERVVDELDLTADQQTKITSSLDKIGLKHDEHKVRVRELKGNYEKKVVEELKQRFMSEISTELTQIKKTLSSEQNTRVRQIAFQYFYVIKNRTNPSINIRRLLLDKTIAEGLQISSMQQGVLTRAYESLELGLKKIDSADTDKTRQLLSDTHKSILGILDEQQRRAVDAVIGPPAYAINYPNEN